MNNERQRAGKWLNPGSIGSEKETRCRNMKCELMESFVRVTSISVSLSGIRGKGQGKRNTLI